MVISKILRKERSTIMPASKLPQSVYFQLQEVAKGVFPALVPNDGPDIDNAGLIDLGIQTLIFDTFEDPLKRQSF